MSIYIQAVLFLLISLMSTTVGAISGIGGGVIIKPVLDAISPLGVSVISFLSGCTVLAMSVVSLLRGGKDATVEPKRGTLLAIGAAVGGIGGKYLFEAAKTVFQNDNTVGAVQSIILLLMTIFVFFFVKNKARIHTKNIHNAVACIGIGLGLGLLSAFLGIGGGPINIAILYYCFSMDSKTCAINSIYIILLSQITSLTSSFITGSIPSFSLPLLIVMIAGGIMGGFLGRAFSKRMTNKGVDRLFSMVLILISIISTWNTINFLIK